MLRFILAPAIPLVLLVLACFWGGWWGLAAFVAMTLLASGADRQLPPAPDERRHLSAAQAHVLSVAMGLAHLGVLPLGVWTLAQGTLSFPATLAIASALGLFMGQIANSTGHELIHRQDRWSRRLGAVVFASMLFGHHASAHRLVHHVHVATPKDPNSAPLGMGFWTYLPRAWIGSYIAGLRAETRLRARAEAVRGLHPYLLHAAVSLAALALAWELGGLRGLGIWIALSAYAQLQLLLSDYVQHYGLRRVALGDGRFEPASARHSWNAPHWYSAAMMLNAPLHSDHHRNPGRAFPDLILDDRAMPMLPRSLPEMAILAMMPSLWRRVMDRRARKWVSPADRDSENAPATGAGLGIA